MRIYLVIVSLLLATIQYPLWLGKGGWFRVWELREQIVKQDAQNLKLKQRNEALEADVKDLQNGTDAIEERARYELGMIKEEEKFVQIIEATEPQSTTATQ